MKNNYFLFVIVIAIFSLGIIEPTLARDLVDAASSAQSVFNRIGIAAISIGITLGGILFAMGVAHLGRMLLISGLVGAVAILGAPALVNLLGRVFGASV